MGVKVSIKTTKDITRDIIKNINKLNKKSVEVGVLNGEHKWLAGIHEYGAHIVAENAKYLTVPVHPDAVGKKAGSFSDLIFIESKKGNKFLARKKGNNDIELMYWLTPSVNIPERSFLRAGHDAYIDEVLKKTEKTIGLVVEGKMSQEQYLNMVGQMLSSKIKEYARDLSSPPNSKITTAAKGSSNPLVDTGEMIEGITHRIK